MKTLFLLRGPSGSGKSTIARYLRGVQHETDQFFTYNCTYRFDANALDAAHSWNQLNVKRSMFHGIDRVIVSNTFSKIWEMKPYLKLAEHYNYTIRVYRTPGPWDPDTLFQRNEHGVPIETIRRQINRYEEYDGELTWDEMEIFL